MHWHGIQTCRAVPTRRVVAAQPGATMGDGRGEPPTLGVTATTRGDWRWTLKTPIAGTSRRVLVRDRRTVTARRRHLSTPGVGMGHGGRWESDCRPPPTYLPIPFLDPHLHAPHPRTS